MLLRLLGRSRRSLCVGACFVSGSWGSPHSRLVYVHVCLFGVRLHYLRVWIVIQLRKNGGYLGGPVPGAGFCCACGG